MKNQFSIPEAVKYILATPAPLLLLDTCSLLDIIRQPMRDGIQLDTIISATRLCTMASSNPRNLWVFMSSIVNSEIIDNISTVLKQLQDFLNQADDIIIRLNNAFSIVGPFKQTPLYRNQHLCLHDELKRISTNLIDQAMIIEEDDSCMLRAAKRACSNIPPSRKGSQAKDCAIIEHYFELCRQLRGSGFNEPCVFTSSNTQDFLENGSLKQPLANEFESLDLKYTKEFAWAETELNKE